MSLAAPAIYADLQGLAGLKAGARAAPADNIKEVAAQFESLFVQMMVKSMRDAGIESELFASDQMRTYRHMFDQQISLDLSRSGGLGLAEILVEQLGGRGALDAAAPERPATATGLDVQRQLNALSSRRDAAPPVSPAVSTAAQNAESGANWQPATPQDYIRSVWRHAQDAARQLEVDPAVLVAQSALETGWGRKVIRTATGDNSFNLFGIKADARWQGACTAVDTLEYRDGVAAKERAAFRVYDDLSAAFDDYASLLRDSPRYQPALAGGRDNRAFLQGLQAGGYATDPQYADKILAIVEAERYTELFEQLKNSAELPLPG
ncbi:MAG: flagellar assembly peptidoglycan hydrolase FlgJ [Halioglobus sp.]|nr:flagellar assembly peptidoglycan hydrolase FlgJ [Halioglobus sp.]